MTHRVKATFAPFNPEEDKLKEQLVALSRTKITYEQEIKKIRSKLASKLKRARKTLKARSDKNLQKSIQKLNLDNIASLELKYREVSEKAEQDSFELAISLAKKIVGESISQGNSNLKERIKSVLPRLSLSRRIKIAAHPAELPSLHELCTSKTPQIGIDLEADSRITRGNARIESASGSVEVSWESHFDSLVDLLKRHQTAHQGGYDA